jgi:hypothetical protein
MVFAKNVYFVMSEEHSLMLEITDPDVLAVSG